MFELTDFLLSKTNIGIKYYFFIFFDGFLLIIPPILTIFLSLATAFAMLRLKHKNILGIHPNTILSAGRATVCCFDKTGTLTTNDIEVKGHYPTREIEGTGIDYKLLASCHTVSKLNNVLVGDALDIQMLNYSKWTYSIGMNNREINFSVSKGNETLNIYKVFEFRSEFMRMSVIVKDLKQNKTFVFTKGAPEVIRKICLEKTIPKEFDERLKNFTMQGLRILGMSYRELPFDLPVSEIAKMTREETESNLNFIGFLVSENKLKSDTAQCLEKLKAADFELKIISGDNPLTTVQVSRDANIISQKDSVMLITIDDSQKLNVQIVEKENKTENLVKFGNEENKDNQGDQSNKGSIEDINAAEDNRIINLINYVLENSEDKQIAVTGSVYKYIKNAKTKNSSEKVAFKKLENLVIEKCKIYSRMKPEQKSEVVIDQQSRNLAVVMVGDGANDCSALKQADVGISFSEADSSFCAPFSSLGTSIDCVEKVLLEGRGTILNCVEIFKFIMASGMFGYFANCVLISRWTRTNDMQSVYKNFLNINPKQVFYTLSPPLDKITKDKPPYDLTQKVNILSIFGQSFIGCAGLLCVWYNLFSQSFYSFTANPALDSNGNFITDTQEAATLLLTINILLCFSNYAFLYTAPFKKQIFYNLPLFVFQLLSLGYNTAVVFSNSLGSWLGYTSFPSSFNTTIFLISWGFGLLMIVYEICLKWILKEAE